MYQGSGSFPASVPALPTNTLRPQTAPRALTPRMSQFRMTCMTQMRLAQKQTKVPVRKDPPARPRAPLAADRPQIQPRWAPQGPRNPRGCFTETHPVRQDEGH